MKTRQERIIERGRAIYLQDHINGKSSERSERFLFNMMHKPQRILPDVKAAMKNPAIRLLIDAYEKGILKL